MQKPLLERFGRHRGKIRWLVTVEYIPGDFLHYGYRLKLNGAALGVEPQGSLFGRFDSDIDALSAGLLRATWEAEQLLKLTASKR